MIKQPGLFGDQYQHKAKDILSSRFLVPPFSVLSSREGWWQERKRQWAAIGIQSELGRGYTADSAAYGASLGKAGSLSRRYKDAAPGGSPRPAMKQAGHVPGQPITRGDGQGRPLLYGAGLNDLDLYRDGKSTPHGGTSIFDPVLCELVYRWFCPTGGRVLDPFAGGSVRGIVAGELGLKYTGIDLSAQQVDANRLQAVAIGTVPSPAWINGDSVAELKDLPKCYNLLFSCPPYGDLERYSDDPRDLSVLDGDSFDDKYAEIIFNACAILEDNAFAVFVVGDYRDKDGYYRNLPGKTIAMFEYAGLHLYNEAILVNVTGSLPLRINAQFVGSRKLGKTHQTVLVFCKGNPKEFVKGWQVDFGGDDQRGSAASTDLETSIVQGQGFSGGPCATGAAGVPDRQPDPLLSGTPPLTSYPDTGLLCSVCKEQGTDSKQYRTPGGDTCAFGHGGALGVPARRVLIRARPSPAPAPRVYPGRIEDMNDDIPF